MVRTLKVSIVKCTGFDDDGNAFVTDSVFMTHDDKTIKRKCNKLDITPNLKSVVKTQKKYFLEDEIFFKYAKEIPLDSETETETEDDDSDDDNLTETNG